MLRKLVGGLMVMALILSIRAARSADDADIAAQVRAVLKQLDASSDRTGLSRVNLAKAAIASANAKAGKDPQGAVDAWQAARDALVDAARLEPNNKDVAELLPMVLKHVPPPPTQPATLPAATGPATRPGPGTKPAAASPTVKREVTAEINRIRQLEWRPDENPKPAIRVEPETRKKYIATTPDVTPAQINQMSPDAVARLILDSGREDLYGGIHITTDPASLREFKIAVDRVIVQNCATSNCHSGNKAGRFNLFTDKNDAAAVYSNFLIIQKYTAIVNGAERLMVDRTTPESSLLLQFMLPRTMAETPHPDVPDFKSPVRSNNDPRYLAVLKWLKSLDPLAPNYGIDLTTDAPTPVAPKK